MQKKWVICEILMHEAKSWQAKIANTTPLYENKILAQRHQLSKSIFFPPCVRVFFPEKTQKKKVICEIFMPEAKSWQAKSLIIPHHFIQNEHWLAAINRPYIFFWFTMCKGPFSWGNKEKIGNLWKFDVWSQILTGKTCDTTTPLYANQILAHRS